VIEDRQISVETSGGYRPPTGIGERILVVLAGLALVGGALIAVGNLLPPREETAEASSQPSARATESARPSRTPRPRPTPTPFPDPPPIIGLLPGDPVGPDVEPYLPGGWVRALVDVPIYGGPSLSSLPVGTLAAGEVAAVDSFGGSDGFVSVYAPEPGGWMPRQLDGTPVLELFPDEPSAQGVSITWLRAGPTGYVALGFHPLPSYVDSRFISLASDDGLTWRAADAVVRNGWEPSLVAWGPAGWLSVSISYPAGDGGPGTWIATSDDGLEWATLGSLDLDGGSYPIQLASSAEGYLLSVATFGRSTQALALWFSADGRRWEQRPSPMADDVQPTVVGIPGGFFAWVEQASGTASQVSFSPDGFDWVASEDGPIGNALRLAPFGTDAVLAIDLDTSRPEVRAWTGRVEDGAVEWARDPSNAAFDGSAVSAIAAYGARAVALGWDRSTGEHRAWLNRGSGWAAMPVPEPGFGAIPMQVAAGPYGFVTIGGRPSLRATNPVFWRSTGGAWRAEPSPVIEVLPDPSEADCGPPIIDALGFVTTPPAIALVCSRDEPITFVAWSADCDGCYGAMGGVYGEEWLANPTDNQLYLSPIAALEGSWKEAVLHPDLRPVQDVDQQWVRVTGHYDDPAAARCSIAPDPQELYWYFGGYAPYAYGDFMAIENVCRLRFVVTDVEPLGPDRPAS
jgi:hypothetical protein